MKIRVERLIFIPEDQGFLARMYMTHGAMSLGQRLKR